MKKIFTIVIAFFSCLCLLTACNSEREKAAQEKVQGSAQQAVGDLTNDSSKKAEGTLNRAKGGLRSTKEDVKDLI